MKITQYVVYAFTITTIYGVRQAVIYFKYYIGN